MSNELQSEQNTESLREIKESATSRSTQPAAQENTIPLTIKTEPAPEGKTRPLQKHTDPEALVETQADQTPVITKKDKSKKQSITQDKQRSRRNRSYIKSKEKNTTIVISIATATVTVIVIILMIILSKKPPADNTEDLSSTINKGVELEEVKLQNTTKQETQLQAETISPQKFQELTLRLINSDKIESAKENIKKRKAQFPNETGINYKFLEKKIRKAEAP